MLRGIGVEALNIARLEVGFLAPGDDFQSVHIASRVGRGRTPFEIGFGKLVNFNKGHFNGRRALLDHQAKGPRYHLVRLDIAGKEPAHESMIYVGTDKNVGHVTSAVWSPTAKRNIALAELKAPYGGEILERVVGGDLCKQGRRVATPKGTGEDNRRAILFKSEIQKNAALVVLGAATFAPQWAINALGQFVT